jgi:hypothetical protein
MCHDPIPAASARFVPRPRWKALYGLVILGGSSLAAVELFGPGGAVRTALRCGVVVATCAAIALWVNLNRISLDAEDWCACAAEKMTIRVIPSPPSRLAALPDLSESRRRVEQSPTEVEHVLFVR